MAKFCKYCGTKLEDGEVCTCPESVQAAQGPTVSQETQQKAEQNVQQQFGELTKGIDVQAGFRAIVQMMKKPKDGMQELMENIDAKNHLVLWAILALIQSILMALAVMVSVSSNAATSFLFAHLNYASIIFTVIIGSLLITGGTALILWGAVKVLGKAEVSYTDIMPVLTAKVGAFTMASVVATFVFIMNAGAGILFLVLAELLSILMMVVALNQMIQVNQNMVTYIVLLTVAVVSIIVYFAGTAYIKDFVQNMINSSLKNVGTDMFNGIGY